MANRHPLKFNEDGTLNEKWRPRKSGPSGRKGANSKSGKKITRFDRAHFIAYDSEGVNTGKMIDPRTEEHISVLWANSEGDSISNLKGLSIDQILNFLADSFQKYPKAIHVAFGASYDMNMALKQLPMMVAFDIWENKGKSYTQWKNWLIKMMPRKSLSLIRLDPESGAKMGAGILYDAIGFFQSNFVNACERWLGKDYADLPLIIEGKSLRHEFGKTKLSFIKKYNEAELDALVLIMGKLRDALDEMGLRVNRWYGAGAVCGAMFEKHKVKEHIGLLPDAVFDAARYAYFGGRIEMIRQGYVEGEIYDYDLNSAYPDGQRQLPALATGKWVLKEGHCKCEQALADDQQWFSMYLVEWDFTAGPGSKAGKQLFFPFPFRSARFAKGMICFPASGRCWVWAPEVRAAYYWLAQMWRRYGKAASHWDIRMLACWQYRGDYSIRPFGWMLDYYERRQEIVAETKRTGVDNGEEKIIKLGLNSAYGKTAQSVGSVGKSPPYANLAYAGYITSLTRARLFSASASNPDAVIAMATDGILCTGPLDIEPDTTKKLGGWSLDKAEAVLYAQSGVYWVKESGRWSSYTRGFDRPAKANQEGMRDQIDKVLNAWEASATWDESPAEVWFPSTRLIGLGSALTSPEWFARWGAWHRMQGPEGQDGRRLSIADGGGKRRPHPDDHGTNPARGLRRTLPILRLDELHGEMSLQHTPKWLDADLAHDSMIDAEHEDSDE